MGSSPRSSVQHCKNLPEKDAPGRQNMIFIIMFHLDNDELLLFFLTDVIYYSALSNAVTFAESSWTAFVKTAITALLFIDFPAL